MVDAATVRTVALAAGLVAVGYVVYRASSIGRSVAAGIGDAASAAGQFIRDGAGTVAGVVDTGVSAPVYAVGDALGLPRTSETECERAKREGRTWDASFACPAGDFLGYLFKPGTGAAALPQASYDETERLAKRYPVTDQPISLAPGDNFGGTFGYGMP